MSRGGLPVRLGGNVGVRASVLLLVCHLEFRSRSKTLEDAKDPQTPAVPIRRHG